MIAGSIAPLGGRYVITLDALACQSGESLATEQVEAAGPGRDARRASARRPPACAAGSASRLRASRSSTRRSSAPPRPRSRRCARTAWPSSSAGRAARSNIDPALQARRRARSELRAGARAARHGVQQRGRGRTESRVPGTALNGQEAGRIANRNGPTCGLSLSLRARVAIARRRTPACSAQVQIAPLGSTQTVRAKADKRGGHDAHHAGRLALHRTVATSVNGKRLQPVVGGPYDLAGFGMTEPCHDRTPLLPFGGRGLWLTFTMVSTFLDVSLGISEKRSRTLEDC